MGCETVNSTLCSAPLANRPTERQQLSLKIIHELESSNCINPEESLTGVQQTYTEVPRVNKPVEVVEIQNLSSDRTHETLLTEIERRSLNLKSDEYPYNCIGVIFFECRSGEHQNSTIISSEYCGKISEGFGNAFLISRTLVVTSAHVVDPFLREGVGELKFIFKNQRYNSPISMITNALSVKKIVNLPHEGKERSYAEDYAILELSQPVQRQKYILLGFDYCIQDVNAVIAAYKKRSDTQGFHQTYMEGKIKKVNQSEIKYDIDTQAGQSGAPVLIELFEGIFMAVGIHAGKVNIQPYNTASQINANMVRNFKEWVQNMDTSSKFIAIKMPKYFADKIGEIQNPKSPCLVEYENMKLFENQPKATETKNSKKLMTIQEQSSENSQFSSKIHSEEGSSEMNGQLESTQKQYQTFTKGKTFKQLYSICKDQFKSEKYHQSLILLEILVTKFGDIMSPKQKMLIQNLMALNYHNLDQTEYAVELLIEMIDKDEFKKEQLILAGIYNNLGAIHSEINNMSLAQAFLEEGQIMMNSISSKSEKTFLYNLGIIKLFQSEENDNEQELIENIEKVISFNTSLLPSSRKQLAEMYFTLSLIYSQRNKCEDWIKNAFKGLIILKKIYQEEIKDGKCLSQAREKYLAYAQREKDFLKTLKQLISIDSPCNDCFLEGLMMLRQIQKGSENKEIRDTLNEGLETFKKKFLTSFSFQVGRSYI